MALYLYDCDIFTYYNSAGAMGDCAAQFQQWRRDSSAHSCDCLFQFEWIDQERRRRNT